MIRRVRHWVAATAATSLLVSAREACAQASVPATTADTLRLYYMAYPIGYERWSLAGGADGTTYTADFDYVDRGRRTHLAAAGRLASDGTLKQLEITRLTDTSSRRESRVTVDAGNATVEKNGTTAQVKLPATWFAISGQSPISQHLLLVRYWLAHGRPAILKVVPGGPTNDVQIVERGRDTVSVAGVPMVLSRYAVNGVVWGWESVWLDPQGRLAGFTTAGGGGLILEGVRLALDAEWPRLRASATRDRMGELAALTKGIAPVAAGNVALVGATVIPGTGAAAIPDATVLVAEGRITALGPRQSLTIPAGVRRIDVRGKTIAPGLWDMHTHLMQWEWAPVYLATGVTTVRDMGNVLDFIMSFRAEVDSGRGLGPRMLLAGLIDGGGPNAFGEINATTPEEGRQAVRRYHALGFEQMKLYSLLTPAVVAAICDEAHKLGMTVTGHVPTALSLLAAVDSGQDQIAHLPIRGEAGSDSVRAIVDALAKHHTVIDPTASWGEILGHAVAQPVATFQPGVDQLPPVLAQRIRAMGTAGIDTATAHARLARSLGIIGALYRAGVPVVAGTDEGVPGFSVYREIELYVQAGMSPGDALRAASGTSAQAMRLADQVGTLEVGKAADLIVLDANPLTDISNVRSVRMVMKGGTLYRNADIWKALGFTPRP
ncbi:MAG: amidohydrolase family protein [Gemmatimonadaceae bacterium]